MPEQQFDPRNERYLNVLRQEAADNLRLLIKQETGHSVLRGAQLEFDNEFLAKQTVSAFARYVLALVSARR